MRAILVDWLFGVQYKFKLEDTTLFLAINYLDRYLELREVKRSELQLIGATALFLASKYEEVSPPEVKDFVFMTDKAYTQADFLTAEAAMLKTLNHSLTAVTPNLLLSRLCALDQRCNKRVYFMANYLVELALLEYRMLKYKPSVQAAAALYLAHKVLKVVPAWEGFLEKYTGYTEPIIKGCAKDMCALMKGIETSKLQEVKHKYGKIEKMEVSKVAL